MLPRFLSTEHHFIPCVALGTSIKNLTLLCNVHAAVFRGTRPVYGSQCDNNGTVSRENDPAEGL